MEEFLFNIDLTSKMVYLAVILLVIGKGLKGMSYIDNWLIIWILLVISLIISFVFSGFSFDSLLEAFIATSIAVTSHQVYKQTNEGIRLTKRNKN
ncbi:MAG: phage holin family protein [Bacilli bacterium]|jgi:NhaP-type Na+/H+ or K+/H+ antiporter